MIEAYRNLKTLSKAQGAACHYGNPQQLSLYIQSAVN